MPRVNKIEIIINAKDNASNVMSGVGKNLQTIGKMALGGLGALATAAGGAGAALAKMAIDAAPIEGIEKAFRGVAEASGKSADEMLAALERGSQGMVTQADLMESYNKAAMLVSDTFANTLPDAMGFLSKVSAATGQDMGFMLDSLVTGVGRLSPMILDNLGIQVDLNEAYEDYAKQLGISVKEMTKTEQQAALMAQVMLKLEENTAAMPEVAGSAAQQIAALGVRLENLKNDVGRAFLPVLESLLGLLGQVAEIIMPLIVPAIEALTATLTPVIEALSKAVEGFIFFTFKVGDLEKGIRTLVGTFLAHIGVSEEMADKIMGIVDTIIGFAQYVSSVVQQVISWVSEFISWKDILIALGIAIATVVIPFIVSLVAAIAPLIAVGVALIGVVSLIRNAWEGNWDLIREKVQEVIDFIVPAFQGLIATIAAWLEENWPMIQAKLAEWAASFWDWMTGAGGVIETAGGAIQSVAETISEWLVAHWPIISAKLTEWAGLFWNWITEEVIPAATEKLVAIIEAITKWAGDPATQEELASIGERVGKGLANGVESLLSGELSSEDTWTPILKGMGAAIVKAMTALMPTMKEAGAALAGGLISGVAEGLGINLSDDVKEGLGEAAIMFGSEGPILSAFGLMGNLLAGESESVSKDMTSNIKGGTKEVSKLFKNLNDDLVGGSIVPSMFKSIIGTFSGGFSDLIAKTSEFINQVIGFLETLSSTGKQIISDFIGSIVDTWIEGVTSMIESTAQFAVDVMTEITALAETVIAKFTEIKDDATEAITAMIEDVIEAISQFASDFVDALSSVPGDVVDLFSGIGQDIIDAVGAQGILDSLASIGESWIGAIRTGIEAKWQELLDWVGSLLDQIPDLNPFDGATAPAEPVVTESPMFAGGGRSVINNFNLTVNSQAETSPVIQSFQQMQALVTPI